MYRRAVSSRAAETFFSEEGCEVEGLDGPHVCRTDRWWTPRPCRDLVSCVLREQTRVDCRCGTAASSVVHRRGRGGDCWRVARYHAVRKSGTLLMERS